MDIGIRRLDDNQLPRLNHRPTRYYLVRSKLDPDVDFVDQWIVGTYATESEAIAAAESNPKVVVTDCRDWTPEELDLEQRSFLIEFDDENKD
jgi:hypothetical protein